MWVIALQKVRHQKSSFLNERDVIIWPPETLDRRALGKRRQESSEVVSFLSPRWNINLRNVSSSEVIGVRECAKWERFLKKVIMLAGCNDMFLPRMDECGVRVWGERLIILTPEVAVRRKSNAGLILNRQLWWRVIFSKCQLLLVNVSITKIASIFFEYMGKLEVLLTQALIHAIKFLLY